MKKLILPAIAASLLHVGVSHAEEQGIPADNIGACLLYTSPSPRD